MSTNLSEIFQKSFRKEVRIPYQDVGIKVMAVGIFNLRVLLVQVCNLNHKFKI